MAHAPKHTHLQSAQANRTGQSLQKSVSVQSHDKDDRQSNGRKRTTNAQSSSLNESNFAHVEALTPE